MITFTVPGKPIPQGSMRAYRRRDGSVGAEAGNVKMLRDYRARVAISAHNVDAKLLDGPVEIAATFVFERPKSHLGTGRNAGLVKDAAPRFPAGRPDLDKLVRALLDGLAGVCFHDDAQVVSVVADKVYVSNGEGPHTAVEIQELRNRGEE